MNQKSPPLESDEDAYIFVDHRDEEASIVLSVSERLAEKHALQVEEDGELMSVIFQSKTYPIPLQISRHDRYIMISSLAELLREHYAFFLLKSSLDSDTHGLLVAAKSSASAWNPLPGYLVPLELGYDYFSAIRVPYLGNEDSAPSFSTDQERVNNARDAMGGFVAALFSGKLDNNAAAKIAALAAMDPALKTAAAGKSETEIARELQQFFDDALQSPEMLESRNEMDKSIANLRLLSSSPRKPWWMFW
jgi:hypothetical protein